MLKISPSKPEHTFSRNLRRCSITVFWVVLFMFVSGWNSKYHNASSSPCEDRCICSCYKSIGCEEVSATVTSLKMTLSERDRLLLGLPHLTRASI